MFDAEASLGHPAVRSLFAKKISTGLHNHIKKKSSHVLIAISHTSLVRWCQLPSFHLQAGL